MARSSYTDAQKIEALDAYRQHGPGEAARMLGIPQKTISTWAHRAGMKVDSEALNAHTEGAVERARIVALKRRAELKVQLLARSLDALDRMGEPHEDFVGTEGLRVVYARAPAGAFQKYALAVEKLVGVLRLESGEVTGRTESVAVDKVDREIAQLLGQMRDREKEVEA